MFYVPRSFMKSFLVVSWFQSVIQELISNTYYTFDIVELKVATPQPTLDSDIECGT